MSRRSKDPWYDEIDEWFQKAKKNPESVSCMNCRNAGKCSRMYSDHICEKYSRR